MLDILQINRGSNALLCRNLGAKNRTATARRCRWATGARSGSIEPNPNRNAVGAKISIKTGTRTQTRFVDVGGGDASGHAGFIHVGLGTAERAEIRVQWPDGDWSPTYRVFANQFVVVDRTEAAGGVLVSGTVERRAADRPDERDRRLQLAMTSFTCMIGSIFV